MKQLKKRYKNYSIGVGIYVLINLTLYLIAQGFPLDKVLTFFLFEDFFLPGSVIAANFLFDRYLGHKFSFSEPLKKVGSKVLLSLAVIILATIFTNEMEQLIGFYDDDTLGFSKSFTFNAYWTNVIMNSLITLVLCIPAFVRENIIDKKEMEMRGLSSELNLLKLELYSSNVRPHFIFNTLNGIVSLIHDEPNKAERMVLYLSDFLRSSLFSAENSSHCVKDEFSALEDYLNIEQIRFDDNFTFDLDLDDDVRDFIVPKFFLLPIIENAIKYNRNEKNIRIVLSASRKDDKIVFEVIDSGAPFPEQLKYNAGINGTIALLKSTYEENFELIIENEPQKVLRIEIRNV